MSHRKHDDPRVSPDELKVRKQKLVEGSVIFVIALSLCIYLGIRFAQHPVAPDIGHDQRADAAGVHGPRQLRRAQFRRRGPAAGRFPPLRKG